MNYDNSKTTHLKSEVNMRNRHRRYRDTDDSPFDERGLLKDGRIYRARMTMMDARSVPDRPRVTNLDLRPGVGCHRPGYRILTDAADRQSAA